MAVMMSALYDALLDGGTSTDKARHAAEEVANFDDRTAKVEADLVLLKWMAGSNIGLTIAVLLKLFVH